MLLASINIIRFFIEQFSTDIENIYNISHNIIFQQLFII